MEWVNIKMHENKNEWKQECIVLSSSSFYSYVLCVCVFVRRKIVFLAKSEE